MSSVENGANDIASCVEQLTLDEITTSLDHVRDALKAITEISSNADGTMSAELCGVRGFLENAVTHCENAVRLRNSARTQLGVYLLSLQTGATPKAPPISLERAIMPATRHQTGNGLQVRPERVVALPALMNESRNLVWARVNGKVVPLLESLDDRAYQGYVDNWKSFREAGLPVPPLFLRSHSGTLLIPEVKEDGSELYGAGLARDMYHNMPRERPRPEIDTRFIELTGPDGLQAVEAQLRAYVTLANTHNLQLPGHDPFQLLVRPDGTWELVIRDLRTAKDFNRYPHYRSEAEVHARNEQSVALWLVRLRVLRQYLVREPISLDDTRLGLLFTSQAI